MLDLDLCLLGSLVGLRSSPLTDGGSESKSQASVRVEEMGAILTLLVVAVILVNGRLKAKRSLFKSAWSVGWKVVLVLLGYGVLVESWREFWTPARGLSDTAMFLPVVGSVNARFFAEVGWLIYLFQVAPLLSIISVVLYVLDLKLSRVNNERSFDGDA